MTVQTDEQLKTLHGDHPAWSIQRWRGQVASGETTLDYVDWRCDNLWCAAQARKNRA